MDDPHSRNTQAFKSFCIKSHHLCWVSSGPSYVLIFYKIHLKVWTRKLCLKVNVTRPPILTKINLRDFWGNPFNTEFRPPWQMWPKNQSLEYLNQWSRWAWQALELWQLASPAKGWSLISFTALISDLYSLIHICNSIDPDILGGPGYSDDDAGVAEGHDENGEDPGEGEKVEEVCELLKIFWKDCFIIQLFCPSSLN